MSLAAIAAIHPPTDCFSYSNTVQKAQPFNSTQSQRRRTMTRRWRVGILGLGHWYSAYSLARTLPEYPKAELVAVAWPNKTQLDAYTDTFHIEGYTNYDELIGRDDIDILHIVPPVSEIPECTIRAAKAGKHIIVGKPMAMTVEQADRMVEAVERAGVTCVTFQGIMRLRAAELKARIDKGEIGDIILIHQTGRWSIAEDWYCSGTPGWFVNPEQVPGGAFIDEGIYWLDLFRWLSGSEVVQVEAKMANWVHKDIQVEDWGMATFTFANGIIATLEASWTINAPRKTAPSPKQNSVVRLEIVGTRGEIIDQWFRAPGRAVLSAGASHWVYEGQPEELFAPPSPFPLNHLIDCLERNHQPVATIQEARKSFIVAMAAYESAREKRPVRLAL
jgi:predicted dehydrogenase